MGAQLLSGKTPEVKTRDDADVLLMVLAGEKRKLKTIEDEMNGLAARRIHHMRTIADGEKELLKFAQVDRKNWLSKTLPLPHGELSFLTSPGRVVLIKKVAKKFDDAITLIIKCRSSKLVAFLRPQPPMLDKELITAEFTDGRITNEDLAQAGLRVDKPEICVIRTSS